MASKIKKATKKAVKPAKSKTPVKSAQPKPKKSPSKTVAKAGKATPAMRKPTKASAKPAPKKAAAKKSVARKSSVKRAPAKKTAAKKTAAKKTVGKKSAAALKKKSSGKKVAAAPKRKNAKKIVPTKQPKKVAAKKAAAKPVKPVKKSLSATRTKQPAKKAKAAPEKPNRPVRQTTAVASRRRPEKVQAHTIEEPKKPKGPILTSGMYAGIKVCENPGPLPAKAPYSDKELEKLKEMLRLEREDALQSLRYLENLAFSSTSVSGDRETPGYSTHPAEFASDYAAADTSLGLRNLEETRLAQVDEAVQRMQEGLYGVCVACGAKIGMERLKAKPFAVLCVPCRSNYEKLRSRGYTGME